MTSFYLNENNDIEINDNCIRVVSGCDELIQCIKQRIFNIDWSVLFPVPNLELFSAIVRTTLVETDGVIYLSDFQINSVDFNCGRSQFFSISFTAVTDCGTIEVNI